MTDKLQFQFKIDANSAPEAITLYWELFDIIANKQPNVQPGDILSAIWAEDTGWVVQIERQPKIEII